MRTSSTTPTTTTYHTHTQHNRANIPNVNSKMATEPNHINDEETAHTVSVIDLLNKENDATEQQRDAACAGKTSTI
jgi:hypothetical protein